MSYLTIDIGGTFIKYAVFDASGKQLGQTQKVTTMISQDENFILDQVLTICEAIQQTHQLEGVAIASAGVVDSRTGTIIYAGYTIPGYTGTQLKAEVEAQTQLRCTVINDVNAAALGELWQSFTSEDLPHSMVCLTIGTGVGGAIVIDGDLYEGHSFTAGEVGYIPIKGQYFQDIASTTALLRSAKQELGYAVDGEQFFQLLKQDQEVKVKKVFAEFIDGLSQGLLTIQYLLNPQVIVIGGGVMAQADIILPALMAELKAKAVSDRFIQTQIVAAQQGNHAGMLGALYYHLQKS